MNKEEYLNALIAEVSAAKERGAPGVFKIREKLTDEVALWARNYFTSNTPYRVEISKCPACAFEWDILIIF